MSNGSSVHALNRPATLRDVLAARNYVAHTVINSINHVLGVLGAGAAIWLGEIAEQRYGTLVLVGWKLLIKPSSDLLRSEELCNDTSAGN
jgi:hypothetical protein